jgi:hypothetical protein
MELSALDLKERLIESLRVTGVVDEMKVWTRPAGVRSVPYVLAFVRPFDYRFHRLSRHNCALSSSSPCTCKDT